MKDDHFLSEAIGVAHIKQTKKGSQKSRVIFVIEDETVVRVLMRKLLQEEGYQVLEAANGTEARNLWAQKKSVIDLLVTDLVMPEGFTGTKLVADFRREKPSLPVIFASGYDIGDFGSKDLPADAQFIQKPFDANAFLTLVQNTVEKV